MQPFESPHSMSLVHFFPERPDGSPLKIRRGLSALHPEDRGGIVTIGNFDGVHRGHQAILSDAVAEARAAGVPAVAVTFEPHPREVVRGIKVPRLTPFPVKAWLLARSGIDALVVLRFTQALAATDPATAVAEALTVTSRAVQRLRRRAPPTELVRAILLQADLHRRKPLDAILLAESTVEYHVA